MFTMHPEPRAIMAGRKHLSVKNVDVRLLSMLERQSSSVICSNGIGLPVPPPANATTKSGAPSSAWMRSRIASTDNSWAQSAGAAMAWPWIARMACTVARIAASSRPLMASLTPFLASARQVSAPIPREPPVTMATLPWRSGNIGTVDGGRGMAAPDRLDCPDFGAAIDSTQIMYWLLCHKVLYVSSALPSKLSQRLPAQLHLESCGRASSDSARRIETHQGSRGSPGLQAVRAFAARTGVDAGRQRTGAPGGIAPRCTGSRRGHRGREERGLGGHHSCGFDQRLRAAGPLGACALAAVRHPSRIALGTTAHAGEGLGRPGAGSCGDAGTNPAQGHRIRPALRGRADARVRAAL